jgi:FlaA1/EpsC-like NDP-sugar epimerase
VPKTGNRLLLVVYGDRSYDTVKALVQYPSPEWTPVSVLSTHPADVNHTLMGVPVVGDPSDLAVWIERLHAQGVAFVINDRPISALHHLFTICLQAELPIFIVPDAFELLRPEDAGRLRPLSTDDLVGRAPSDMEVE